MTAPAFPDFSDPSAILPAAFLDRTRSLLKEDFPLFLESYRRPPHIALRVNTLKCSAEDLQKLIPGLASPVPGTLNGFYYPEALRPGLSPYHDAGLYYIQEPSAICAANEVDALPGERVLDLCAAPGGKATAIAAQLKGRGLLVANEIIPKRAAVLSQNIERLGITNAVVTNHTPAELARRFPLYFDRILIDAPCSGEGMFKKEPQALEMWSEETVRACAARQDEILSFAHLMLRPEGRLIYSTCTFSPAENEDCISRFLAAHSDYSLINSRLLWPHLFPGEGQFFAVLQKNGLPDGTEEGLLSNFSSNKKKGQPHARGFSPLSEAVFCWNSFAKDFFAQPGKYLLTERGLSSEASFPEDEGLPLPFKGTAITFGEQLYLLPCDLDLSRLKVLRPGLHLGTLKQGRLIPSHSLALALSPHTAKKVLNISQKQACEWISGQPLLCGEMSGWCLVCVNGFTIGFGKAGGGRCNNHYPKGLRRKTVAI